MDKIKKESEKQLSFLRSEIDLNEQNLQEINSKTGSGEEVMESGKRLVQFQKESRAQMEALKREINESKERIKELEYEKTELKNDFEKLVGGLNEQVDKLKIELNRRNNNQMVNNSMIDNDDLTILLVENENLKRKIKVLENETSRQNANDKFVKKNQEKETEIASLKQKNNLLEKALVVLLG